MDKIFLNKWIAFPIFIVIMFLIYYLSIGLVGRCTIDLASEIVNKVGTMTAKILKSMGTSEWLISLIVDGIIAGVGAILGYVPQLIVLFVCVSLLETTGYMSRIALMLDKIFRKIGLSGKSLIPFIVGLGCSVPGIMGTKIIENEDERKITTILTPFVPCSAKLPIISLFTGYFFPENAGIVSASLYFLAIIIIMLSAILLKTFMYTNTSSSYILELPEYKLPNMKYITKDVLDRVMAFIKRTGTVILICSIIVWFLLSFSTKMEYGVNIENSILASIGNKISWILHPIIGTNSWEATVSTIQGLVAKEQVVSSMTVIKEMTVEDKIVENEVFANNGAFGFFTKVSAYAFIIFNLFSAPCIGAIGAMKKELGKTKEMLLAILFQTTLAWILATSIYQIGRKFEEGIWNWSNIIIILIIILLIIKITISIIKNKTSKCINCPYVKYCNKN